MSVSPVKILTVNVAAPVNKLETEISKKERKTDDHDLLWTDDDHE